VCTRALARLYIWMRLLSCPSHVWIDSVCDVSCGQVFTERICVTKAFVVGVVKRYALFAVVNAR